MRKFFINTGMLLLGIIVATSCSNEESLEQMANNGNIVQAVIENEADTRTSVNDSYQVVWTADDKFDVWDGDTFKGILKLKAGAGSTSASFKDNDEENPVGATIGMTAFFPSYDGESSKKAFVFAEKYESLETDAPMLGSFDGSKFTFNLLTAMVRVVVTDVPAGEISFTISSKNSEILTGEAVLNNENKLDVPSQGKTSVSVNFTTDGVKTLTFDVPIPVQNYTDGFQVVVKSGEQEVLNKKTNGFNAVAGKLYLFGATYVNVADADAANEKLGNDGITAVKVQSVEAGDEIAIPAKSETSAQTEHIIDLSEATMPSGGSVTIKVAEASAGNTGSTVEKLTVVVPNNATSGSLTINAPGTTVTIQGADGTVIDVIESTTADQTLIIGAGVTVKSLTVQQGNVIIEASGKINSITNDSDETIYVIYKAATAPTIETGDGVVLMSVAEWESTTVVTKAEELSAALNKSDVSTIVLDNNLTLSDILVINRAITLNGNGKTLTYTGTDRAFQITGGTVVIQNLTVETPNAPEGGRGINLYNGGTNSSIDVTLNGVTVEGGKAYAVNIGGGKDNKLTINNSALTGYAAINVNAASESHTINVAGSTLTGYNHNTGYDFGVVVIDGTNEHSLKITNTTITPNNNEGVTTVYNQLVVGPNCNYEVDDQVTNIAVRNILANGLYYTDLQAAVNEANEESTVTLLGNIQIDNLVKIEKSITLDLNDKTVTAKCQKAFEIYADATIKNGTIISQQRCVDTRKAVNLTLTDLTLNAPTYYAAYGNQQPLTIGGSESGTKVTMSNVEMNAGTQGYCIISFVKTDLTATNSNLSGYAALYVKEGSDNSTFGFVNSTLSGTTGNNDVEGNSFATIAIEANSVTVKMDEDCELNSTGTYHDTTFIGEGVTGSTITGPTAE